MVDGLKEFERLDKAELQKRVDQERMALAQMRINATAVPIKDYSQYKKKRAMVARLLTALRNMNK